MKTLASFLLLGIISILMLPLSDLVTKDVSPGEVTYLIQDIKSSIEVVRIKLDNIEKKKFYNVVNGLQSNDYISDTIPVDTIFIQVDSLNNE